MWLVFMYFLPFVGFSMLNVKNWKLTIGLGFIASLMNDLFYGFIKYLVGLPENLTYYYDVRFIPQNTHLFNFNLGFAVMPVLSWMMALSIYLRIALAVGLLWNWKLAQTRTKIAKKEKETTKLSLD